MTLAQSRIVTAGETPHAHEREALQHLVEVIPNTDPFHLWSLVDLLEPGTGRLYEIDAIVLGYSAIYLVEIKSGPGAYVGDQHDWYRADPPGSRGHYLENPYRLTNHKAKVLASRLRTALRRDRIPRVEPLVFLSHPEARIDLQPEGRIGVVDRDGILRAVANHEFPGADPSWPHRKIDGDLAHALVVGMRSIGIRPRKGQLHVGAYELGTLLGEGPGFQDRLAIHRDRRWQRRARVYLVPDQTSVERRQQLRRAAEREVGLLTDVRDHGAILKVLDYVPDAPLGPTVLFDEFDDGVPLDAFLRKRPKLPLVQRVAIVEQVGRALAHCHKRSVVHGSIGPHAVLVRERPGRPDEVEVRLQAFQLGSGQNVEGTSHLTALAAEPTALYLAPELGQDPESRSRSSDFYGLGALAYFVLTGLPPAENVVALHTRLAQERCLDPRAVSNDLTEGIVDLVRGATQYSPAARGALVTREGGEVDVLDDVERWTDELVRLAKAPAVEPTPIVDPLEAQGEAVLVAESPAGERFEVQDVLGHGATSRVLRVVRERDRRELALKVPLSTDSGPRFADEAATLRAIHHDDPIERIVRLEGEVVVAGRACLLLSLAGKETLHRRTAREGSLSLDEAKRYGEDLLFALEVLEEKEIGHRDIKPANLGVGARGKGAKHLTLFDFSLARYPANETGIGTAAYRDPFLESRGWDAAADRWSAAVVLHEMVTATRPSFSGVAVDPASTLVLASDRFDPSVRHGLTAFFTRALAREVKERFLTAVDMRHAWLRALDATAARAAATTLDEGDDDLSIDVDDEVLRAVTPETPIAALPLSARARNALDRASIVRADDLRRLADNRLSAIRGIGTQVAREILSLRDRWVALLDQPAPNEPPFFPGYQGEDLPVVRAYTEALGVQLRDAGYGTLAALAGSPASLVVAFAKRHTVPEGALRAVLRDHHDRAAAKDDPSTLEAWMLALFPPSKKKSDVRALYGLVAPFEGRLDVRTSQLAAHAGITTAAIYIELGKERKRWSEQPCLDRLRSLCVGVLERAWGALPIGRAAEQLLHHLAHDASVPVDLRRARAAALLRVVAEVDKENDPELRVVRVNDRVWVVTSPDLTRTITALGAAADELAARPVPAALPETKQVLGPIVEPTTLAALSDERLLDLAAAASKSAVCSTRLEIVPRALPPERALALCAPLLRSRLAPAAVVQLVAARYPEAERLPDRPALDALLAPYDLVFGADGLYVRKGEVAATTSLGTHVASSTTTPLPGVATRARRVVAPPIDIALAEIDDALRRAIELQSLRVLAVHAPDAAAGAEAVAQLTGARIVALDRLLLDAMKAIMTERNVQPRVVHQADLARDPESPAWGRLLGLARAAGERVAASLLPASEPLLLVQPGLLARYELRDLLAALLDAAKSADHPSILLLVPGHDTAGVPPIEGTLPLPGVLASHVIRLPSAWIASKRSTAAA